MLKTIKNKKVIEFMIKIAKKANQSRSIRGKIRKKVILPLASPSTPTQLSIKIKNHRSTISRTLLILEQKGLVKCVIPKEIMSSLYQLTEEGEKIKKELGC